jgi:hypothetical protein
MSLINPLFLMSPTIKIENNTDPDRPFKFFPHPDQITLNVGKEGQTRLQSFVPYSPVQQHVQVQDVGENKYLQNDVSRFYYEKILSWIKSYPEFAHLKKHYKFLQSNKGPEYIYYLLKLFVKKSAANWYDLRDSNNYPIVKNFLKYKIGNV